MIGGVNSNIPPWLIRPTSTARSSAASTRAGANRHTRASSGTATWPPTTAAAANTCRVATGNPSSRSSATSLTTCGTGSSLSSTAVTNSGMPPVSATVDASTSDSVNGPSSTLCTRVVAMVDSRPPSGGRKVNTIATPSGGRAARYRRTAADRRSAHSTSSTTTTMSRTRSRTARQTSYSTSPANARSAASGSPPASTRAPTSSRTSTYGPSGNARQPTTTRGPRTCASTRSTSHDLPIPTPPEISTTAGGSDTARHTSATTAARSSATSTPKPDFPRGSTDGCRFCVSDRGHEARGRAPSSCRRFPLVRDRAEQFVDLG